MRNPIFQTHALTTLKSRLAHLTLFTVLLFALPFCALMAQTAPNLGTAANFAILAGGALDCGSVPIMGVIGSANGPVLTCPASAHNGDLTAQTAYTDFLNAYISITPPSGDPCTQTFAAGTITDGTILFPGVYCFPAGATFTDVTITLDANGNPNPVWIFKVGTSGTGSLAGTNFIVNYPAGSGCSAPPPDVFWWTADAATLTTSTFIGQILAGTDISITGGSFNGRGMATDAVTLVVGPGTGICGCAAIALSPLVLPDGFVDMLYDQTISATGGSAPYSYTITAGSIPASLTLDPLTGDLSGTLLFADVAGSPYNFTITATDSNLCAGNQAYSITINDCPTIALSPLVLPDGFVDTPYSQTISATGGSAPYSFAVTTGSIPASLTLDPLTGDLSGTLLFADVAGSPYNFTITATDANGCAGDQAYSITINVCPTITLDPEVLANGLVGAAYNRTIYATGGTEPYSYGVTSGSLPNGLTLNSSDGVLSGLPTVEGSYNFVVTATDNDGCEGSRSYPMQIAAYIDPACPAITVSPSTLPNGTVGTAYSQTISAAGGQAPYAYRLTSGSLPGGLTLNSSTGVLSGTPASAGTFAFTVTATDQNVCAGSKNFSLTVTGGVDPPVCPTIALSPVTLPNGVFGVAYYCAITAIGGAVPYTYAVTNGSLPMGFSLSAAGVLSGTYTGSGTSSSSISYTFTVTATDANDCSGNAIYAMQISDSVLPPQIRIRKLTQPFRLKVKGANFHPDVKIYLGAQEILWTDIRWKTSRIIIIKRGSTLKAMFPKGVPVLIKIVNGDGGTATTAFTR